MRDTTFFHFSKLFFLYKLPFPLPWWSEDLLVENLQVAGGQLRNRPVYFRHELWLHLAIDQQPVCQNIARRELWPRKWFLLGRNPRRSACRSIYSLVHVDWRRWRSGLIASTDLWPQEMFTFLEMLALVGSESSFDAYVCHRRHAGRHGD